jgi:N-acetylated-alpha-linked acidic dipeptidase
MESEKPLLHKKEAGGSPAAAALPLPSIASQSHRRRQRVRRFIVFSLIAFVFLGQAVKFVAPGDFSSKHAWNIAEYENGMEGYWTGVASKGMKAMLWGTGCEGDKGAKHVTKIKDKHEKHKHKHKHGKDGHLPPFVPPKLAEHIFLSVPNNDSARA